MGPNGYTKFGERSYKKYENMIWLNNKVVSKNETNWKIANKREFFKN